MLGRDQAVEAGYFARYDHTTGQVYRVRFGTDIPYEIDDDHATDVFDLAGYVDLELRPTAWLTLRGGVRQELFDYDVLDGCATDGFLVRNGPVDVQCPTQDRAGVRLNSQRLTASGSIGEKAWSAPR